MALPYLDWAFEDGRSTNTWNGSATIESRRIGTLVIPTGRIMAFDPGWIEQAHKAFDFEVEPGEYPVILSVAHFDHGDTRNACAMVRFREDAPVAAWTEPRPNSYTVENGVGCFVDARGGELYRSLSEESRARLWPTHHRDADSNPGETVTWDVLILDASSGLNMMAFETGYGDGAYPCFVARDCSGNVLSVLTDFLVLGSAEEDEEGRRWWQFWK